MSSLVSTPNSTDNRSKAGSRLNIILGISGSVAAVKGPELALKLSEAANVKIV